MKAISIQPIQKPINSELTIPGSKSYTNRGLLLAALTNKNVKIVSPLVSGDTEAFISCLKQLGIKVSENDGDVIVAGNISSIKNRTYKLNAHLSGTTIRFMLALSTIIPGVKILFGKEGLNKRPIGDLVDGLHQLGAKIEYLEKKGFPPLKVLSSRLNPGTIKIKGSVSSQYVSAILMIAPLVGEVTIKIIGKQISKPYIDMTIDTMKQFGVTVSNDQYQRYKVSGGQKYETSKYVVEGDYSSAAYFFAIAALTKSTITVRNLNPNSVQADKRFLHILEKMGNKVNYGRDQITIEGKGVKPVDVDMENCPDQIQTLAVLASFAKGITKISGVQSLRIKETDRILALKTELKKMGVFVSSTQTALTIYGGNPQPASIETYGDHRMAMSFAIAGSKLAGMKIIDPDVVNKTFPTFWEKLKRQRIVLIGFMGAGKSSVAPLLAEKLNLLHIEMDELVLKESKQKTINDILKKQGETIFRSLEEKVAKSLNRKNSIVISAGGGVIMNKNTMRHLRENAVVIFLDASFETVKRRLIKTTSRPLWNDQKKAEILYKSRMSLYKKYADVVVTTDNKSVDSVVEEILVKI